jgi:hypothetical protein
MARQTSLHIGVPEASDVQHRSTTVVVAFIQTQPHWRIPVSFSRRAFGLIAACTLLVSSGCSDPLGPFQPEITNVTDNFQLQATGVTGVSSTLTYRWTNSGTRATINHSTTTTAGGARLVVRDQAGAIVYDKTLVPSLNEPTATGPAGTWTIELTLTGYSGTLNFRAQKL